MNVINPFVNYHDPTLYHRRSYKNAKKVSVLKVERSNDHSNFRQGCSTFRGYDKAENPLWERGKSIGRTNGPIKSAWSLKSINRTRNGENNLI